MWYEYKSFVQKYGQLKEGYMMIHPGYCCHLCKCSVAIFCLCALLLQSSVRFVFEPTNISPMKLLYYPLENHNRSVLEMIVMVLST